MARLDGAGPLSGVRVVEFAGLGAVPFTGMMLADFGADVVRVDRPPGKRAADRDLPGLRPGSPFTIVDRGRTSIALDLKQDDAVEVALRLVERADVLIEGFRPGVMERLGLGPGVCHERRPALVYGRVTGWGQDGPLAHTAGHDIDYIALAGALQPLGEPATVPAPPLNMLGDLAGGGMLLVTGVLAALLHARATGRGQVIDAAMVDGAALLSQQLHSWRASGELRGRGQNVLDGGAPFYTVYRTADDRFMAVGAGEPAFYGRFVQLLGLDPAGLPTPADPANWPALHSTFAGLFATRSQEQWTAVFDGQDACVAPVLAPGDAAAHPHLAARGTFEIHDGVEQPAPAPRFSGTPATHPGPPPRIGADTGAVLRELGYDDDQVAALRDAGAIAG